jgi:hypothetical protein
MGAALRYKMEDGSTERPEEPVVAGRNVVRSMSRDIPLKSGNTWMDQVKK